ncbi:MAG: hypothetical protein UY48_C0010G0009 [Candidatus Gottesmanbacteria bacterium GW2011_GWB1_49_7]|uniref:Uncharacterized protein n=1 Tax=Candidatus Gottesmanbacteria bacterium GW2011_GWB1_49_7 TaxID=1618448 RepID=A0A0G1YCH6_9BACT|nr:MAG: hypothetical protein UY48_C0010G0009 [Candidatus Gottesmanbacteria bacterium GW2011_GWB1_49_7]
MESLLTNDWFNWIFSTYSVCLGLIPVAVSFILKLIAIFHPGVPSDKIIDLIQKTFAKKVDP